MVFDVFLSTISLVTIFKVKNSQTYNFPSGNFPKVMPSEAAMSTAARTDQGGASAAARTDQGGKRCG